MPKLSIFVYYVKTCIQLCCTLSCTSQTRHRSTFLAIKSTLLVSLVFRSARLCATGVSSSSGDEEQPPISLCHSYPMFIYLYVKLVCIFHNGCGVVMVCAVAGINDDAICLTSYKQHGVIL